MPAANTSELTADIRELMDANTGIAVNESVADDADLFDLGMQSLDCVRILVAVEDEFEIEIPNEKIDREMFTSIRNLAAVVAELLPGAD